MKATFLGVGEAADESLPNTSILLEGAKTMLLDCGYSAVQRLWQYSDDQELLDAVWISHQHADHTFGFAALLCRMKELERKKPLLVLCREGLAQQLKELVAFGYPGVARKLTLHFQEVAPEKPAGGMSFAPTTHSVQNLATRIAHQGKTVCYSGDGASTPESEGLYKDADLLIHEAYELDDPVQGHGLIRDVLAMAKRAKVKKLALVHVQRDLRRNGRAAIDEAIKESGVDAWLPEPGETLTL